MSRSPMNPPEQPDPRALNPGQSSFPESLLVRPPGVFVITAVLGLESLALAVAGIWSTIGLFSQKPYSMASAVFLVVIVFALAAGLAAVAVNAFKGNRWTRSATFVWQLLMVTIAVPALLNGATMVGLVFLVPPLVATYFLFTPKVVAFSLKAGGEHPVL